MTSLASYASAWRVGQQHVFFDVRSSSPMDGGVHDGVGEWHVYRGGARIAAASAYGILDFSWIGLPGDEVKARFVDRAGNAGSWVTYTFAAAVAPVLEVYVDPTLGNNANPGTLGSPIATRGEARARALASLTTAGQSVVVYLKRGEVHGYTGSGGEFWAGDDLAFAHQVRFVAYGTGARPLVQVTSSIDSSTPFRTGKRGSIHLVGIEVDCVNRVQGAGGNTAAVNAQRNGAGTRAALDLLIDDCVFRNCTFGVLFEDDTATDATIAAGECDFFAMRDLVIEDVSAFHMFQGGGLRNVHRERVTFRRQYPDAPNGPNTDRTSNWQRSFCREMVWDTRGAPGANGGARWQAGPSASGGPTIWRYGSYIDCEYFGGTGGGNLPSVRMGRHAPDGAGTGTLADVRWVNLRTNGGQLIFGSSGNSGGNNIDRVQAWSCTIGGSISVGYLDGGTCNSVEIRDCATSQAGPTPSAHIGLIGTAARYAAGSITVTGHVGVQPSSAGSRALIDAGRCTAAEAAVVFNASSNFNHVGRYGDATVPWFLQGGVFGILAFYDLTLAQWRTQRGDAGDANSTATGDSSLGIVSPGTSAAYLTDFDPRYSSGSGPLDGLGSSRPYSFDGADFLRSSPSDPGPFEFGATATASLPAITGDGSAVLSLRTTGTGAVVSGSDASALLSLAVTGSTVGTNLADGAAAFLLAGFGAASEGAGTTGSRPSPEAAKASAAIDLFGGSSATTALVCNASFRLDLVGFGVAEGLRAVAVGAGVLGLTGASSGTISTNPPVFGCKIVNTSASRFVGWWHVNTDLAVSEAYGQRNGTTFVRGEPSGVNTRMVSVLVDLASGATLELPDFVAQTTTPPAVPTVPANFFGGDPAINGAAMTLVASITDGQATVQEWRYRSGVWQVYIWTVWVPGEPWARCEVVVLHSNPTSASLRENWPGWALTWGTGTVQALGRAADGSLVASGRGFGDGQCQPRPVLVWWPSRYRDAQDATSVAAQTDWLVMGHAIQNLLHDGTPLERTGSATWAAITIAGHVARLDNWDVDSNGILKQAGPTGGQGDHMFVREEPRYYVAATRAAYIAAMRWGAKPCHHVEMDGRYIDLAARPTLRMFDGRPHPPTTGDMLGKPGPINPAVHSEDWDGPGMEHDLTNGLDAATRYTGSRALGWILGAKANLYLGSRFPPGFGSNSALFSTRGLLIEAANSIHMWRDIRDRTLATAIRDRVRVRATSIFAAWVYPTHGYPAEYWQVYTSTSASVPDLPGYIPWQQGPCAYFIDLAERVFGGLDGLTAAVFAGVYQVLDDVWSFEFSPTFGAERWVEYERIQLPKPYGLGIRSRSGDFAVDWIPPAIALIRRMEPSNAKANAIWAQMLAQLGGGGKWMPPSSAVAAVDFARGSAVIGLAGSGAAIVESGEAVATGAAAVGLAGEATAELGPIVPAARGAGMISLFGEGDATDAEPRGLPGRNFRRPYWIWLWRSFRR